MTSKARQYDEQFRRRAVDLAEASGNRFKQTARQLDMPWQTLARWVYMKKKKTTTAAPLASSSSLDPQQLHVENERLRRQLADVEEQRDILKKALAICSADPRFKGSS